MKKKTEAEKYRLHKALAPRLLIIQFFNQNNSQIMPYVNPLADNRNEERRVRLLTVTWDMTEAQRKRTEKGFKSQLRGNYDFVVFLFVSPPLLRVMSNIANRKDSDGWFTQNVAIFLWKIILNSEVHLELLQPLGHGHCWLIYNFSQNKSWKSSKICLRIQRLQIKIN